MKNQFSKWSGVAALMMALAGGAQGQSAKGVASEIPAYYDAKLLTIQFVEFSAAAEKSLLQHNQSLNFIYQSDQAVQEGFDFVSVIDAIPTDGFNPVWQEVQITFVNIAPQQFFSDDQVLAAAKAGDISLAMTDEVYWCPIVGPGNH
jgi:hypothetical protein